MHTITRMNDTRSPSCDSTEALDSNGHVKELEFDSSTFGNSVSKFCCLFFGGNCTVRKFFVPETGFHWQRQCLQFDKFQGPLLRVSNRTVAHNATRDAVPEEQICFSFTDPNFQDATDSLTNRSTWRLRQEAQKATHNALYNKFFNSKNYESSSSTDMQLWSNGWNFLPSPCRR